MKEVNPIVWPDGWPRTLIQARIPRAAWKKTERESIEALEVELERFSAVAPALTRKDSQDFRTAADPSIAVYFSRRRENDYGWQTALRIDNPSPTIEEIETAFKRLAARYHPDNQSSGDIETYHALDRHKKAAISYVNRRSGASPEFVMACDKYTEARWNITAIRMSIHSLRQLERDGASHLLQRAMQGFVAALPEGRPGVTING